MQAHASAAHSALLQWNRQEYKECLGTLQQIEKSLEADGGNVADGGMVPPLAKLKHNIAVAKYASSGDEGSVESLGQELREVLASLGEESSTFTPESASSASENNKQQQRFQPDSSVALYNQAVLLVHERQLKKAFLLLEDLFQYIDAIDERIALCICFLLLDLFVQFSRGLGSGDGQGRLIEKAHSVVDYLEKPHDFNGRGSWNLEADQGENAKSLDVSEMKNVQTRLKLYKAKLQLIQANSPKKADVDVSDFESLMKDIEAGDHQDAAEKQQGGSAAFYGVKPKEDSSQRSFSSLRMCLEANKAFLCASYRESLKLLEESRKQGLVKAQYLNNVGCVHHALGQHGCAAVYFSRAAEVGDSGNVPEILFNLGVELLHERQPVLAYDCFMKSATCGYHRPLLWLRISECVAMSHEMFQGENVKIRRSIAGAGLTRRLVLNEGSGKVKKGTLANKPLSLASGLRATANVLYLLGKTEDVTSSSDATATTEAGEADGVHEEFVRMKLAALLTRAYLALVQQNWPLAYSTAHEVVKNLGNTLSQVSTLVLAHSYCAEASLWLLPKAEHQKALDHLGKALELEMEESRRNPSSSAVARCNLCVNMALLRLMHGDLVEPESLLHKALGFVPGSPHALRGLVYLYLSRGDTDRAKRLLKTAT